MPLSCQAGVLGVRAFVGGEDFLGSKRRDLIGMCKALEDERHVEGNAGVTVVVLR